MISFEEEYFQKFKFTSSQITLYLNSALRDLAIARDDKFMEVRSVMGHHIKILNKLSEIMGNPDIFTIGNAMRMKRNKDLYDAAATITQKEVNDCIVFVDEVIQKAKVVLK